MRDNPYRAPEFVYDPPAEATANMRPFWVDFALPGVSSRVVAWAHFWFSITAALLGIAYLTTIEPYFVELLFVLPVVLYLGCAWWYHQAIDWLDRNDAWNWD
jgi:hypothetical protein